MPDSVMQIGLIILLIAPGYFCYSIKEMLISYREKSQFEKLVSSLVYSAFVWAIYWIPFQKTPRYYLMEGSLPELISFFPALVLFIAVVSIGFIFAAAENRGLIYWFGDLLSVSVKVNQGIPLLEYIFNDVKKEIGEILIYTEDDSVYRGFNLDEPNKEIIIGAHPHSGDFSFVCNYYRDPQGKVIEYNDSELVDEDGLIIRTFISKNKIKRIGYTIKDTD